MNTFKIYDWSGQEFEHPIKGKIKTINVKVISGDEVVTIVYADGTTDHFDAGEGTVRMINFDDGSYQLDDPDEIERWLRYDPGEAKEDVWSYTLSDAYLRRDQFIE